MEPKAHHVVIGFFTLAAVAAALLFALWLGKSSADREWAYYQIGFDHPVSGLTQGNPVLYSGIQVGDVLDLTLAPDNPAHVRVLVRVHKEVPVRKNTKAGLILANITGSMSIQFTGGTPESPQVQGDRDNPPLILAEPSALNNLLNNGEALLAQAERLLTNMNRLLATENVDNVSALLGNAREASESLLANREALIALMEQFNTAAVRAEEAAIKVSGVSDNTRAVLNNQVVPVLGAMDTAISTLQPSLERVNRITANNEHALDSGLQGLSQLDPALRELRTTLRTLNNLTRRLEQDPAGALWGRSTIKEFEQ